MSIWGRVIGGAAGFAFGGPIGAILGVKIKENMGVFTEGRYLYYWESPAYDIKFGINYQFVGW